MSLESIIKKAVDDIFLIYDYDQSNYLELEEAKTFFGDFFERMGEKIPHNAFEIILYSIDKNGGGKLSKNDLIRILSISLK